MVISVQYRKSCCWFLVANISITFYLWWLVAMSLLVLIFIVSVRLLVRLFRVFPFITVLGVCHSVQQVFKIFSTWGHKASMRTDVISVAAWNTHFMHLFKHFVLSLLLSSDRLIKTSHIVNDFHNLVEWWNWWGVACVWYKQCQWLLLFAKLYRNLICLSCC